jgi:site-specific DNA-methyltransferase (adenine-specific)
MEVNKIYQGNALEVLKTFPNESINCCITSPPYWSLRDYGKNTEIIWGGNNNCEHDFEVKERRLHGGTMKEEFGCSRGTREMTDWKTEDGFCSKCNAWKGQLGLEPDFNLYISHLCDIFDEVKRVLRKDGTCWVNIADTYYTKSGSGFENDNISKDNSGKGIIKGNKLKDRGLLQSKSLCNIPARFSIEMQNRGWILRNVIIWNKPNCMPSSIKDRFTIDFEYIFFLVKNKKYYFETQYEHLSEKYAKDKRPYGVLRQRLYENSKYVKSGMIKKQDMVGNPTYTGFNERYKEKQLQKNSPQGRIKRAVWTICPKPFKESHFAVFPEKLVETPLKAGCPKDGIVLDPFIGSGTTGIVALKQNKKFIGIELNPDYIEIAMRRLKPYLEQQKLTDLRKNANEV